MRQRVVERILTSSVPSPVLAVAQGHTRALIHFFQWFNPKQPGEGINELADNVGIDVNDLKESYARFIRKELRRIQGVG